MTREYIGDKIMYYATKIAGPIGGLAAAKEFAYSVSQNLDPNSLYHSQDSAIVNTVGAVLMGSIAVGSLLLKKKHFNLETKLEN